MIVAVEGPSAAGKTTWCADQGLPVVEEYTATGREPTAPDEVVAGYWTEVSIKRWERALTLEQTDRLVLCDTDPLKLHYIWGLWRLGSVTRNLLDVHLRAGRAALADGHLGFADLILISIPPIEDLRRQRDSDRNRRRSGFDLHAALAAPLREWYQVVEALDPARVLWSFPERGVPHEVRPRVRRSDPTFLDEILRLLPSHPVDASDNR